MVPEGCLEVEAGVDEAVRGLDVAVGDPSPEPPPGPAYLPWEFTAAHHLLRELPAALEEGAASGQKLLYVSLTAPEWAAPLPAGEEGVLELARRVRQVREAARSFLARQERRGAAGGLLFVGGVLVVDVSPAGAPHLHGLLLARPDATGACSGVFADWAASAEQAGGGAPQYRGQGWKGVTAWRAFCETGDLEATNTRKRGCRARGGLRKNLRRILNYAIKTLPGGDRDARDVVASGAMADAWERAAQACGAV